MEEYKGWEDEEEGVSRYWMNFRKREDTGNLKEVAPDRNAWRHTIGSGYGQVQQTTE
jgi:hypothetical protein